MPTDRTVTTRSLAVTRTAQIALLGPPDAPTWWVVLHGYGQRAADFLQAFAPVAADDRCLIAPEALSRFYTDGMDNHRQVGASWMTRAAREDEIDDYVRYLDAVAADLQADDAPEALHVLGFSQGAATASRWAALGTTRMDRLTLWAGDLAHDLDLNTHAATFQALDLSVVVGTDDPYISGERQQALLDRLARHDIAADVHTFDGGHRLDRGVLQALAEEE